MPDVTGYTPPKKVPLLFCQSTEYFPKVLGIIKRIFYDKRFCVLLRTTVVLALEPSNRGHFCTPLLSLVIPRSSKLSTSSLYFSSRSCLIHPAIADSSKHSEGSTTQSSTECPRCTDEIVTKRGPSLEVRLW